MSSIHLINHNKVTVHAVTTGVDAANAKLAELEGAFCFAKNFQVSKTDKWEVVEVACD